MKVRWLPFSYLLHDNAGGTKNIGGLEGPAFKFWPGPRFGSRWRWTDVKVPLVLLKRFSKHLARLWVRKPYVAHSARSICMGIVQGVNLYWSKYTKRLSNSWLKHINPNRRPTGSMSCGLMKQRSTGLDLMGYSVYGDDPMNSTKKTVLCLQSNRAVVSSWYGGCTSAAGTGEIKFIDGIMDSTVYCNNLKEKMVPSLQKVGKIAVLQHSNDP